jgi:hypothetical protein
MSQVLKALLTAKDHILQGISYCDFKLEAGKKYSVSVAELI